MNTLIKIISAYAILTLSLGDAAWAAGRIRGSAPANKSILAIRSGESVRSSSESRAFNLVNPGARGGTRLYIVDAEGQLDGTVIAALKHRRTIYSFNQARAARICRRSATVAVLGLKPGNRTLNIGGIKVRQGQHYINRTFQRSELVLSTTADVDQNCKLANGVGLGSSRAATVRNLRRANAGIRVGDADDVDADGLVDEVDADDDGDGTLDNYDSDTVTNDSNSVRVFSNFKLNIESSLNANAQSITQEQIDEAMSNTTSLAIAVAGSESDTVELNCGGLNYCSTGGTGRSNNQDFPGTVGNETFDADADGFGTIVSGQTGDFQLVTGATSSEIGAGNVLTEIIKDGDGNSTEITGILNFTFNTTPALKTLAVNEDSAVTVTYPAAPGMEGSANNCFEAPASGDVVLHITAWRPQRPGIAETGEGTFVDIGNSSITIDIPNTPCTPSGGGGCSGMGPGNCIAEAYAVPDSETNVTADMNGLRDTMADQDADAANTFSFEIDLSTCLNNAPGGAVSWAADQTLYVDLQMGNNYGDNAAQKFCVKRAAS